MNVSSLIRTLRPVWVLSVLLAFAVSFLGAGWWQAQRAVPPPPSPIDIGFAQAMSVHHQQAIAMAQLMLDGRPTPLAMLARQIAYSQLLELGEMRGWLKLWNAPLVTLKPSMDWMLLGQNPPDEALKQYLLDCAQSPTGMTGLATDAEVGQLRSLDGRERDAHFLKLMLAHHQGALPMARFAAAEGQERALRQLASNIVREQSEEIFLIQRTQQAMAQTELTVPSPILEIPHPAEPTP